MDHNVIFGQLLIQNQMLPRAVVEGAYQSIQAEPGLDLLDWLLQQGLVHPTQAHQIRQQALNNSDLHQQNLTQTLQTSSGERDYRSLQRSSGAIPTIQPVTPQVSGSSSMAVDDLSATIQSSGTSLGHSGVSSSSISQTPKVFGDYKVIREISRGGMGAVYLAYSVKLQTEVALKTLLAGQLAGEEAVLRFRLEAQATARLTHPNIVSVHDIGESDGHHYLVMDFIEGRSLKAIIQDDGPYDGTEAAEITVKLAKALSYAHQRGILHRDIKPENVLVRDDDDEVLLTDFGLAKDMNAGENRGLTMTGQIMGTPEFMSPEQADGRAALIDQRSDIYSLGATLYQLLTGSPPFTGETLTNILKAIMTDEPAPPSSLVQNIDRDLEVIVLKCLEKELDQRYQHADELVEDLRRYLHDEPILAKAPSQWERIRRWRRRHKVALRAGAVAFTLSMLALAGPATSKFREDWARDREMAQFNLKAEEFVAERRKDWENTLTQSKEQLDNDDSKLSLDSPQVIELQARLQALSDQTQESKIDAELNAFKAPSGMSDKAFQSQINSMKSDLMLRRYGARAAIIRSLLAERLNQKEEADIQRLRALSLDPLCKGSEDVFLVLAQSLLAQQRYEQTILMTSRLMTLKPQSEEERSIKAQAMLATAEAYFRLGKVDNCYQLLQNLPDLDLHSKAQKIIKSRLKLLSKKLRGAVELILPYRAVIFKSQNEKLVVVEEGSNSAQVTCFNLSRVDQTEGGLHLTPTQTLIIPGAVGKWGRFEIDDRQVFWALTASGAAHVYQFTTETATRLCLSRPQAALRGTMLFALGQANDNEFFDGVFRVAHQSRWFMCLDIGSPMEVVLEMPPMSGSWSTQLRYLDLDGDGRDELIMGEGAWNTFALAIYKGFKGSSVPPPAKRPLGIVEFMSFNRVTNQQPELLMSSDRNSYYDVGLVFGPDLSPKLPDGIWSLKPGMDQPRLVLSIPFAERDFSKFGIARRMASFVDKDGDKLIYALQLKNDREYTLYFDYGGPNPLSIPNVSRTFDFLDFDKNGDKELFFALPVENSQSQVLKILGLHTRTRDVTAAPTNLDTSLITVQLNLISTLLAGGQYQRALLLTGNLLAIKGLSKSLKLNLELNRARILLASKEHKAARETALRVARESPLLRQESLNLAMSCADEMDDYLSALSDLDALLKSPTLTPALEQLLRVRREAYQNLAHKVPLIQLNKSTIETQSPPMHSEAPWNQKLTDNGVSFHSRRLSDSALTIPVHYEGGSFQLRYRFHLKRIEYFTAFKVGMHEIPKDRAAHALNVKSKLDTLKYLWQIGVGTGGNGDIMTWDRGVGIGVNNKALFSAAGLIVDFPPGPVDIEATYRHDNGLLRMKVSRGGTVMKESAVTSPGLKPGDYEFHIMAVVEAIGRSHDPLPWACEVSLEDFVLSGKEGDISPLKLPTPFFSEAGMSVLRGDMARAVTLYRKSLSSPSEQSRKWEAQFGLGLALARSGQSQESQAEFAKLRAGNGPIFRKMWERWLYSLKDAELKILATIELEGANLSDAFNLSLQKNDIYRATLLSVLIDPQATVNSPVFGRLWYLVGNQGRAETLLNSLANKNVPIVQATLGLIAFHRQDYPTALKYWSDFEMWDAATRNLIAACRIRSIFLLKNPHLVLQSKHKRN